MIGYIGRINQNDHEKLDELEVDANYRGTDYIGKTGLEQSYENELHGTTGFEQVEVDAGGARRAHAVAHAPLSGNNLTLTLDAKLQEVAEKAFGDRRGALVAIDPSTGGMLAFVSKPGFDPNLFVDGIDPQSWDELNNSPDRPMINRALAGTYPPGSTFKPFMALAALESGKRTPKQTINDPGYFNFGGHRFRDDKTGGHGNVDMYKSIVVSCDTYYYMLANDMGIDNIASFMAQFGFGAKTGIDIDGEAHGHAAVAGVEAEALQQTRAAEMVCRRDHLDRHRPGLQRLHADAARPAHRDARQQRRDVPAAPGVSTSTTCAPASGATIEPKLIRTIALKPENIEFVKQRDGRRQQGRHRRARLRRRASTRSGRQDRHRAGDRASSRARSTTRSKSPSATATMRCSSPSRRPTTRRSRSRCWSRTAASARAPPRRSRAR